MAATFQACPACARHIKVEEGACPFCGARTPEGFANVVRPRVAAPLSRAAILFVSATAVTGAALATGCGSSSDAGPVVLYGPAPIVDSGTADSRAGDSATTDSGRVDSGVDSGNAVLYGPAPVDSGTDEGPMVMYGPAVVDSGMGEDGEG